MTYPSCLLVDDEPDILDLLAMTLEPMNIACHTASNVAQAQALLEEHTFNLCLTDMRLPDGNGIDLITYIQHHFPNTPVAMITAHGNVESAVHALKSGAFDFVSKPIKINELRNLVRTALQLTEQRDDVLSNLIGESQVMRELRGKIQKLARSQAPVYIRGESGSGKEIVAHSIHKLGARADKPFVPVNCGAIPSELMESEFFGHKKGSFTNAHADKPGLFESAQGGTLFLDEIADLPLNMQVKLLRAIQEKQIRPIGARKEIPIDVRILSATHRDLTALVKSNKFREDLFYRINVIEIYVPPLRERMEDLPLLVERILCRCHTTRATVAKPKLSEAALETLKSYTFPGNVRELENIIERAVTLCENNVIEPYDLQLPTASSSIALSTVELGSTTSLDPLLEGVERETILSALEQTHGNKTHAAKLLGINIGALRYRMQKFKME